MLLAEQRHTSNDKEIILRSARLDEAQMLIDHLKTVAGETRLSRIVAMSFCEQGVVVNTCLPKTAWPPTCPFALHTKAFLPSPQKSDRSHVVL